MQVGYARREKELSTTGSRVQAFLESSHSVVRHLDRHPHRVFGRVVDPRIVNPDEVTAEHPALGLVGGGGGKRREELHLMQVRGLAAGIRSHRQSIGGTAGACSGWCDNWPVNEEANVSSARRGFEAAVGGDFETIGALLDADVKWHGGDPSASSACHGRSQALDFMRRARRNGRLGELIDVVAAGPKVVVIMRPPAPETRGPGPLVANLVTFTAGKVTEMVHYADPEDALAAARESS